MTGPTTATSLATPDTPVSAPSSRQQALTQAVANGIARWRSANRAPRNRPSPAISPVENHEPGSLGALPRRKFLGPSTIDVAPPPQMKSLTFRVDYVRAFRRLVALLTSLLKMSAAVLWDWVRGRNSAERRAVHLRRMFERLGGTFVTIGQHLATPLQLLQSPYGDGLSRIVDATPPFPIRHAIDVIERTTGKPLAETFAEFDPQPVISTSTSCTYQAVLRDTGEKVVAKVRRPGIGELFVADLKAFDWIATVLELFTIFKPGQTKQVRRELRDTLLEEIDYVREARNQDRFRRVARKSGKSFFTAPRVHFELSGDEVIVQEFAAGMWLWELLAAVEQNNAEVLNLANSLNIDKDKVARRLLWVSFWSWDENLFFLANPGPHNIILGENGKITFIDFSSTGAMDRKKRRALKQNLYYAGNRDPLNMARVSLTLLEPLPPVDVIDLTKELEAHNWQLLYAFETRGVQRPWYERTTMLQWSGLAHVAQQFGIVVDIRVMRLLKAALMHETLAVRLNDSLNVIKEFEKFTRGRAARATRRAARRSVRGLRRSNDKRRYLKLEQLVGTGETLMLRMRHALTIPKVNFQAMTGKGAFSFMILLKFSAQALVLTAAAAYATMTVRNFNGLNLMTYREAIDVVLSSLAFRVGIWVLLLVNARAVLFRLEDKDI